MSIEADSTGRDPEIGNFIDALLEGLELIAQLEEVYEHGERIRRPMAENHKAVYQTVENIVSDFEHKTGMSARKLLIKWNKSSLK